MTELVGLLFYLALASFLAHELDAVHKREWRALPVLRGLPDDSARRAFVLGHVPVVALALWAVGHPTEAVGVRAALAIDVLLVVHAGLHWRAEGQPGYWFTSVPSRTLIYGSAGLALAHLVLAS